MNLRFDALDHLESVLALPHHDDAGYHLALTVPVGRAAPQVGAESDVGNLANAHGHSGGVGRDHDLTDVLCRFDVPAAADHVLRAAELHQPSAHIVVALPHRIDYLRDRHVVGLQL